MSHHSRCGEQPQSLGEVFAPSTLATAKLYWTSQYLQLVSKPALFLYPKNRQDRSKPVWDSAGKPSSTPSWHTTHCVITLFYCKSYNLGTKMFLFWSGRQGTRRYWCLGQSQYVRLKVCGKTLSLLWFAVCTEGFPSQSLSCGLLLLPRLFIETILSQASRTRHWLYHTPSQEVFSAAVEQLCVS